MRLKVLRWSRDFVIIVNEDEGEDEVVETKPPAAMIEDSSDEEVGRKEPDLDRS